MSTDRELLELAAKAAGYHVEDECLHRGLWVYLSPGHGIWWNPLTDDGDALRLAVKINEVRVYIYDDVVTMGALGIIESHDGSDIGKQVATRRAIVRAAAEIGRNMK